MYGMGYRYSLGVPTALPCILLSSQPLRRALEVTFCSDALMVLLLSCCMSEQL